MKIKILPFFIALGFGLISVSSSGQITITQADFPTEQSPFRYSYYWGLNDSLFTAPTEGADQVWDYQGIAKGLNADFEYYTTTDPFFDETYHYEAGFLVLSEFLVKTDHHSGLDMLGYYNYAQQQYDTAYSLTAVTGGAMDELHFVDNKQYYGGYENLMFFPLTYGDWWGDTLTRTTPFEITVQAYGLNDTPGYHERTFNLEKEVVGHGTLLMTDSAGQPSDSMDVLLVKSVYQSVDSFFINGQPAPDALLAGLGISQGAIINNNQYFFYRKGYGDVVLEIESSAGTPGAPVQEMLYNENGIQSRQDTTDTSATAVSELNAGAVRMFPNPVKVGESLRIDLSADDAQVSTIRVLSADGSVVLATPIANTPSSIQIALPLDLASGAYLVQVLGEDGNTLFSKRLMVAQ